MWWKMGGRFKREGIYVYLWLIYVDIWLILVDVGQKLAQFCKAVILQLTINKKYIIGK